MSDEAHERESHEALIGQVIARKFRLVRLLGAGGMGAVYEAEDLLLKRCVALKLMKPEVARNRAMAERFIREGRAANALDHPNIVRVHDLAMDDEGGTLFIVQELLSGESLADRLDRDGRVGVADSVAILDSVLDALAYAHELGIVHRDIKPDNVFLHRMPDGSVVPKIIDFGISKVTSAQQEGLAKTQTGTALGTPYYMSPEQIRGDSNIDHRADLWSAGVMAFEMMSGQRPFQGENYNMLIINIITNPAPEASAVEPSIPQAVSEVIKLSLMMDREQRFSSARAMRLALDEAVLESGARVTNVIPLTPAPIRVAAKTEKQGSPMSPPDSLAAMSIEPAPIAPVSKRPGRAPLVGALLVGVLGVAGVGAWRASVVSQAATSTATPNTPPVVPPRAVPETRVVAAQPPTTPPPTNAAQNSGAEIQNAAPVPAAVAGGARAGGNRRGAARTTATSTGTTETPSNSATATPSTPTVAATTPTPTERPAADPPRQPPPERPAANANPTGESPATNPAGASAGNGENTGGTQPRRMRFTTRYPQ
ncbi:MAG: serine/threonine protein kinase [Myxococcales bacterium]|nr:serine/threonine protein kinase [Myxococcales bacterium]